MKKFRMGNLKLLGILLTAGITLASPMNVHAEGEILYIQTEDEHTEEDLTEETKEDMIKAEEEAAAEKESEGAGGQTGETVGDQVGETVGDQVGQQVGQQVGDQVGEQVGEQAGGQTGDTKQEYGEGTFIDSDNWSKEQDSDPNAGNAISSNVATEQERKHIGKPPVNEDKTPSDDEKKDDQPDTSNPGNPGTPTTTTTTTPVIPVNPGAPKTGTSELEYYLPYIKLALGIMAGSAGAIAIGVAIRNAWSYSKFLDEQEELDDEPKKVVKSRKKKRKRGKTKTLRRN